MQFEHLLQIQNTTQKRCKEPNINIINEERNERITVMSGQGKLDTQHKSNTNERYKEKKC